MYEVKRRTWCQCSLFSFSAPGGAGGGLFNCCVCIACRRERVRNRVRDGIQRRRGARVPGAEVGVLLASLEASRRVNISL